MRLYNKGHISIQMKNLYKIIALFAIIFLTGVYVTVITVNATLNKVDAPQKTVEIQKDTTHLLKAEKKTV
ncbi:hypothetical protein JL193_09215 [Polaribacter batillariae]|uniref:Uncharacterized protein n=1 Tax=Polaribacter batillariae TaxID=2808900 RepID=A0ABX7T0Y6_9FLAO|nr:hypothetical protein [Polaribacter batillariae]QTD39411.1 hypothetical protein JL193_09215 [Polaribacter batillariae]